MAKAFRVRRAENKDMKPVFELSNDPVVRAHSIHTEPISWETHVAWFNKTLTRPDAKFFVAESADGQLMAQIRFNHEAGGWVISVSLTSAFRGKGLAKKIVQTAMDASAEKIFVAEIHKDNAASQHLFSSLGFVSQGEAPDNENFIITKKVIHG